VSNLSKNFTMEELTKTDVRPMLDENIASAEKYRSSLEKLCNDLLEPIRKQFGPIMVNSGYRMSKLNKKIGGSPTSQHVFGQAADINAVKYNTPEGRAEMAKWVSANLKGKFHQALVEFGCLHIALATGTNDNQVAWAEKDANGNWVKRSLS